LSVSSALKSAATSAALVWTAILTATAATALFAWVASQIGHAHTWAVINVLVTAYAVCALWVLFAPETTIRAVAAAIAAAGSAAIAFSPTVIGVAYLPTFVFWTLVAVQYGRHNDGMVWKQVLAGAVGVIIVLMASYH
jgi:hypothetical protein